MEDIEFPSFSLGLDLDFDSNPQPAPVKESIKTPAPEIPVVPSSPSVEADEELCPEILKQHLRVEDLPPALKRLRRGPPTQSSVSKKRDAEFVFPSSNIDDDIEEFSEEEDPFAVECLSVQNSSLCSSSKFPLHGHKVLMTQPVSKPQIRKTTPSSTAPTSINLESSENKQMFPKLTISPLRKFQLFDSDSDDPSATVTEDLHDKFNKINSYQKEKRSNSFLESQKSKEKSSVTTGTHQTDDLWKDFCPKKIEKIQTPALNEFCEEYFKSVTDKNLGQQQMKNIPLNNSKHRLQKNSNNNFVEPLWDNHLLPAHHYFCHEDPRIQKLVCERLPNFFPHSVAENKENMHSNSAALDYRSQFGHKESSSQFPNNRKTGLEGSSNRGKRRSGNSYANEVSHASLNLGIPKSRNLKSSCTKKVSQPSQGWADPKSSASIPKDAGKRRIQADGHSAGHWYTGQDGRKVYVSKNGQEFIGQIAYRQYEKESGQGFKASKKKTTLKRK